MTCQLDLDFFETELGGLDKLRAKSVKALTKYKRAGARAHYQAIIDAIDAKRESK
jgi:hypothetical protein